MRAHNAGSRSACGRTEEGLDVAQAVQPQVLAEAVQDGRRVRHEAVQGEDKLLQAGLVVRVQRELAEVEQKQRLVQRAQHESVAVDVLGERKGGA